jgi:RNA polymerase sigma factor (sigma-70 family)
MNDWQLVSAYVHGDEGAFADLVAKYFRMVYTIAVRQVGDLHLAEEVAQSVFIILSRKAGRLSSSVSVCGWLVQTTRFVSRDAVKMRQRRQQNEQEFASSLERSSAPAINQSAIEAMLDEALLALPAAEQAGVMAHFFEGRNFKEIGEMLAISEDGAQKRVSRSLAKLRTFLTRRGAKVPMTALAGLLTAQFAREASAQTLSSAIQAAQSAVQGKLTGGNALALANHAARVLRWRAAASLCLKLALPVCLLIGGRWAARQWSGPARSTVPATDPRIEALAKRWSVMVLQIAGVKKEFAQTSPNDPRFQTLVDEVNSFAQAAAPISDEFNPLLTPPHERDQVAEFLTGEVGETLKLDASERRALFSLIRDRLAEGATLLDAMKAMRRDIPAEATAIKALLSPEHQRSFDSVYGPDGSCLFVYLTIATGGK